MDSLNHGIGGQHFQDIFHALISQDRYMALADFKSYREAQFRAERLYQNQQVWNKMGLVNIAHAGRFAADRSIRDYAGSIWHASPVPPEKNLMAKMDTK